MQKFLEYGTDEHKSALINSIQGNVLVLSLHVYGCRVVQKAIEVSKADIQVKRYLIFALVHGTHSFNFGYGGQRQTSCRAHFFSLFFRSYLILYADLQAILIKELEGHVMQCVRDQNGNHVIQKCIEQVICTVSASNSRVSGCGFGVLGFSLLMERSP